MSRHGAQVYLRVRGRGLRWLAVCVAAVFVGLFGWGASVAVAIVDPGQPPPPPLCVASGPWATKLPVLSPAGSGAAGTILSFSGGIYQAACNLGVSVTAEQWYRGSTAIPGATSPTYTTQAADANQPATPITVQLTVCDTADNCIVVTPVGMFVVETAALGAPGYYPVWSHGPVSVNEAQGNAIVSLPTPSYPTATGSLGPTATGSLGFSLTWNSQSSVA